MSVFLQANRVFLDLPYEVQGSSDATRPGLLSALALTRTNYATVLADISFRAAEGDRVGILGLNGAGKTTLLKVLNGALPPTMGHVERQGSLQSLLTTVLGFNEYATVAENMLLRGTAMGLRYRQVMAAMDEILDFAELSDKANRQLHTLSAGQRMRLGFAISTAIQPDILLMDEWIGTGDAAFVEKARQRMMSRFSGSKLSVIASHSISMLRSLCNRALVLDKGRMLYFGDIEKGIEVYQSLVAKASPTEKEAAASADPLLFGDVLGGVERLTLTPRGLVIKGWAASMKKGEVAVVVVETPHGRFMFDAFQRIERPDVNAYLGKKTGAFGFEVMVPCRADVTLEQLASALQVFTGMSEASLGKPIALVAGAVLNREA